MQLIDVTNSYARKIRRELMNTPVHFIKVFTLGNSKVVFKKKNDDAEIIISNKLTCNFSNYFHVFAFVAVFVPFCFFDLKIL